MQTHDDGARPAARAPRTPNRDGAVVDTTPDPAPRLRGRTGNGLTRADVVHLQRSAGNAATARLLAGGRSPVFDVVGKSGGRPLEAGVRRQMEGAFGQDFSDVRIHTGREASRSAASVQASAYAVGNEIVFRDSAYSPGTGDGKRRLAHELTHVVQQREGPVDGLPQAGGIAVSSPSDRFEQAADANADRVMTKLSQTVVAGQHASAPPDSAAVEPVAQRASQSGRTPVSVQRTEESQRLLTKLAKPQIGEAPALEVQKDLVARLESICPGDTTYNLGGFVIDRLPDTGNTYDDPEALYAAVAGETNLVPLPVGAMGGPEAEVRRNDGIDRAAEVIAAGLGPKVVENTLKTMIDAEQLKYLRLAGLPNDRWKILVEVHYIKARGKEMAGFHKDTRGQTLFVNLNYHAEDSSGGYDLVGPEYVINPPPSTTHDAVIGTEETEGTLPKAFMDDLRLTRRELGEPEKIKTGIVKAYGYVAFVDEAIHHSTPYYGHRFVTGTEFKEHLIRKHKAEYEEIRRASNAHNARWSFGWNRNATLESYVDEGIIGKQELPKWEHWLAIVKAGEQEEKEKRAGKDRKRYTRADFAPDMSSGEFDLVFQDVGSQSESMDPTDRSEARQNARAAGWYAANIPGSYKRHPGEFPAIKPTNSDQVTQGEAGERRPKPPLKRQASTEKFKRTQPAQLPEDVRRKIFRCWIRAVPAGAVSALRK